MKAAKEKEKNKNEIVFIFKLWEKKKKKKDELLSSLAMRTYTRAMVKITVILAEL